MFSVIVNNEDVIYIGFFDVANRMGAEQQRNGKRVVVRRTQQDDYENHSIWYEMREAERKYDAWYEQTYIN